MRKPKTSKKTIAPRLARPTDKGVFPTVEKTAPATVQAVVDLTPALARTLRGLAELEGLDLPAYLLQGALDVALADEDDRHSRALRAIESARNTVRRSC